MEKRGKLKYERGKKLTDEQFVSVLRENGGLFSMTAKAIRSKFKVQYSRQAVRDRAEKFPKELEDIREENLDIAEEGLRSLMKGRRGLIKFRAIELFLKTQGKHRGFVEKQQIAMVDETTVDFTKA